MTQQQIDAMVTEDIDLYDNNAEYRQLVDYISETAASGEDVTIDMEMEVEPASNLSDETPPEEQHDVVGAGTERSADTSGSEGGIQDMEAALDDLHVLQDEEVEDVANDGESEHPLQQPPGNGGDDVMDAGTDEGNSDQPPGIQDAEMGSGGREEEGEQAEGMEMDEPSGSGDFVAAVHDVEMTTFKKLCLPPPEQSVLTEQERPIAVARVRAAQSISRCVITTALEYKGRDEEYVAPIHAPNLPPNWLDDIPTDELAVMGLLNDRVSIYSDEVLEEAAAKPANPPAGVRPIQGSEQAIDAEDEQVENDYGDADEEDDEDNQALVEMFKHFKMENHYAFQAIRPLIEPEGREIVQLWNRL